MLLPGSSKSNHEKGGYSVTSYSAVTCEGKEASEFIILNTLWKLT